MFNRILLPLDGSPFARSAVESAAKLAKLHEASIVVFGCLTFDENTGTGVEMSPITFMDIWERRKEELLSHLQAVTEQLKNEGLEAEVASSSGRPVERILEIAEQESCDCIVMATHGRSGFRRWMMGSVTEGVLRKAPCPVIVIPCKQ